MQLSWNLVLPLPIHIGFNHTFTFTKFTVFSRSTISQPNTLNRQTMPFPADVVQIRKLKKVHTCKTCARSCTTNAELKQHISAFTLGKNLSVATCATSPAHKVEILIDTSKNIPGKSLSVATSATMRSLGVAAFKDTF